MCIDIVRRVALFDTSSSGGLFVNVLHVRMGQESLRTIVSVASWAVRLIREE